MRDKIIEIIKTMREQAAIDDMLGEKRCSVYLNYYAEQLAAAIGYTEEDHGEQAQE